MNSKERGFSIALAVSELSNAPKIARRMGACLMAGSRLLSIGANSYNRSHPDSANTREFVLSTHAEHTALIRRKHYDRVGGRLTLYVARHLVDGTLGGSKPCANCLALARLAGVSRIHYYDSNGLPKEIAP